MGHRSVWQDGRRAWARLNGWHQPDRRPKPARTPDNAIAALADIRLVRDLDQPIPEVPAVLRGRLDRPPPLRWRPQVEPDSGLRGHRYGLAVLERECAELAVTAEGRRNHRLFLASLRLYSLAVGGVLDPAVVDLHLADAAARCGLGEAEIQRTVASARRIAARHPRTVPDPTARPLRDPWDDRARDGRDRQR
jgi:hypothetical protein